MGLQIEHETHYTYRTPVGFGPHRLVLRPREGHDLRVEWMDVDVSPPAHLAWSRDVFGNSVGTLHFDGVASELRIFSRVHVRRMRPYAHRERDTAVTPWPPVYEPLERAVVAAYQELSYPSDRGAVESWVARHRPKDAADVEQIVGALNRAVHETLRYERREENGVLMPAETLDRGAGSCRDFATLLLEAARSLGIAARFASGYAESAALAPALASTHAWVEIYLPGHGWRGYDPTAGTVTTSAHVATGLSNDPRGVMPVSGTYYGLPSAFQALRVAVRLSPIE